MTTARNVYFLADAHIGCRALPHAREQERRLVQFLYNIKERARAIYMLGDMFDFWYEYPNAVPAGHTRFLGALSALTDAGVEVHYLAGNHDLWAKRYLAEECGVTLHSEPLTTQLDGQTFFLAHGDGLGDPSRQFRFLRAVFRNRLCQWLFTALHPSLGIELGMRWAAHSRKVHSLGALRGEGGDPPYMGEDKEHLVLFAKQHLKANPQVNNYLFGHRHIELDLMLTRQARLLILGDWVTQCTYALWDGTTLTLDNYET